MPSRRQLLLSGAAIALAGLGLPALAAGRFERVLARLRRLVDEGQLPFASIRLARQGEVLAEAHVSGIETIGPHSLYRIHSMTKPLVAAAVVLLVEDGKLALEDQVERYVPEFADLKVGSGTLDALEPARPMRVAQLLTHSCGLANSWGDTRVAPLYREAGLVAGAWMHDPAIGGLDGFARRLAALPLACQPGTDWIYGYGLDIAGLVVERISGERLGDFLLRRILQPLGMHSTGFFVPETRAADLAGLHMASDGRIAPVRDGSERLPLQRPFADSGSGGLVATLEDYGRFADILANAGARHGTRVMQPASVALLTSPYGPQEALLPSLLRFGRHAPGSIAHALAGVVRLDDRAGPGSAGEYAWGGAGGTGFWATPGLGLSVTVMTQLMQATAASARDSLRPLVYEGLASA